MQRILLSLLSLLIIGCSSSKKRSSADDFVTPDYQAVEKVFKQDYGPSRTRTSFFKEVSKQLNLDEQAAVHLYAVDWNNDGWTDLVVLSEFYGLPDFYRYDAKKKIFVKEEKVIKEYPRVSFLNFADFNKDGLLDFIAVTLNQESEVFKEPLRLYAGTKKGEFAFSFVKSAFPEETEPTSSIALLDYDLDGWLDIFIGNWFKYKDGKPEVFPDNLYKGVPGGTGFRKANGHLQDEYTYSDELNLYTNANPTFGAAICDINKDGYTDIITASNAGFKNKLWLNLVDKDGKNRIFIDHGKESGFASDSENKGGLRDGGNSFYGVCQDYNQDGIFDIALGELVNAHDPETRDRSSILSGSRLSGVPQFIRTEYHKDDGSGRWSQGDRRGIWADLNFDSYLDLIVDNSGFPKASRLIYFEQASDHSYADLASERGIDFVNPSGSVVMDFNRDGRPDLVSGQSKLRDDRIKSRIFAFQNTMKRDGKRSISFVLRGDKANYHGLGAKVWLHTSKKKYLRNVEYASGGLLSQNEEGIFYGLEEGETLKKVVVDWPYVEDGVLLKKSYDLSSLKFKRHTKVILKDNGSLRRSF